MLFLSSLLSPQPNGFLEISNSVIGAQNNEWPSGRYDWNTSAAIQVC
eukprot:COSAG06_NODE_2455_length_6849_cov_5.464148_12_plen_47_part_00